MLRYVLCGVIGLVILLVGVIYIPPVQDLLFSKAVSIINSSDIGIHIDYDELRLKFPAHLEGHNLNVELPGEIEAQIGYIDAPIRLIPLFGVEISSKNLTIRNAGFRLGAVDSVLYMTASVDTFNVETISVGLKTMHIDVGKGYIDDVDVKIIVKEDTITKEDSVKESDGKSFDIKVGQINLKNVNYFMSIAQSIDTLSASLSDAMIADVYVDLNSRLVDAKVFNVGGIDARYIYSKSEEAEEDSDRAINQHEAIESLPWKIKIDEIKIQANQALYALNNYHPGNGFDIDYVCLNDLSLEIDSFYNCKSDITVPIKSLIAEERCGLTIKASGTFAMDSGMMKIEDMDILLPGSKIGINASIGLPPDSDTVWTDYPLNLNLSASIAPGDISVIQPAITPLMSKLPYATRLVIDVDAFGNMNYVTLGKCKVALPGIVTLSADGYVSGFQGNNLNTLSTNVNFNGSVINADPIRKTIVESKLGKSVDIIPMALIGDIRFNRGLGKASIQLKAGDGTINTRGTLNIRNEGYDVELETYEFPIQSFLPIIGISNPTMKVEVKGNRFNPLSNNAEVHADINIDSLYYQNIKYHSVSLNVNMINGEFNSMLSSSMPEADMVIRVDGSISESGQNYSWIINGDIRNIAPDKLGLMQSPLSLSTRFDGEGDLQSDSMLVYAHMEFPEIKLLLDDRTMSSNDLSVIFDAGKSGTTLEVSDRDMIVSLDSPQPLDSILSRVPIINEAIDSCKRAERLEIEYIRNSLPKFEFNLTAKRDNMLSQWFANRGEYFDSLGISISNKRRIDVQAILKDYNTPKYIVDSLTANLYQFNDSVIYQFHLHNSPMSPGDWANVALWGRAGGDELEVRFNQKNHEGATGFLLGFNAIYRDSTLNVSFVPTKPIIGYKNWTINKDNYISIDFNDNHLDANLDVTQGKSSIRLYTNHMDNSTGQEEINLHLNNLEIADWLSLNPFATPMKGTLNGTVALSHQGNIFTGDGTVSLVDFVYGKKRVGNFELGLDVSTTPGGFIHASAELDVDSLKVMTMKGVLNDTVAGNPFMLTLSIDSFPLKTANPFLYDTGIELSGYLNSNMEITGSPQTPVFNGFIGFEKTGIKVNMLGTTYSLSDRIIPLDTGIVRFNDYSIKGVNDNPFVLNGIVNLRDVLNPAIDISLNAKNTQLVGTDRARGGADIYGKAYIDLDATVKGNFNFMKVDAAVTVLNTTDVTYVMTGGAENALTSRSNSGLVKFINFADTAMLEAADSIKLTGLLMNVNAILHIDRGAKLSVDLSADGKNKVQLEPIGDLDYSMDILGTQHLIGRIDIDGGFARYTPPLMSEKLFNFKDGSYVEFNGNISNPILNISAVDRVRANVTQEGQNSRLIYFNVGLDITGTMENMNVAFDLSTDDDLTVENELESMSPSQRASKAMNLLITNMYTGPGTTADANMGANALYSFLGSTLNSWAANNIKAVDLSFGVNQYENTTDGVSTQATSYSYKVSKSLFDDRFKINIGGNYTTDADTDENFTENLISDVSIEYMLNKNGSMYIKLFRHSGYESILEGEVIQTGVGFTYRKRLNSLKQMFWFLLPQKYRYKGYLNPSVENKSHRDSIELK